MDNPQDEKTVINVKGVSVQIWEKAKRAANKQGQPMGVWLSRAADHLANLEDGPREFPPDVSANPEPKTGNPSGMASDHLAGLMQGMAALVAATGMAPSKAVVRTAYRLMDAQVREASGLPPRPVRIAAGKASGQSLLLDGKADEVPIPTPGDLPAKPARLPASKARGQSLARNGKAEREG